MINERLHIEGQRVDVTPNSITRDLQINEIGDIQNRRSNQSKTINLPFTPRNVKVFEYLGITGNNSRKPYQKLRCDYWVNGIQLIRNGYAVIKRTTTGTYETVIYDGIIDISEKLKGLTLADLDYSDLNHYLTVPNYTGSFTNTEGYIYALGDFVMNQSGIKVDRQAPSVFTHTIWKKIFNRININYYGDFFSSNNDFRTEVIAPMFGYEVQDIQPDYTAIGTAETDQVFKSVVSQDFIFNANSRLEFDTQFTDSRITFGTNGVLTFNEAFRLSIDIEVSYSSQNGYNSFQALLNGTRVIKSDVLTNLGSSIQTTINIDVNAGDTLHFQIHGTDTGYNPNPNTGVGESEIEDQYMVDYSASASMTFQEVTGGYLVDFAQIMGDTPLQDIVKDIMQRFGLIVRPLKANTDFAFIQMETLLNDREGAEDWSGKFPQFDDGEEYEHDYAKENKAKYNYVEEIIVPTMNGVMGINNENVNATKDLFTSIFQIPISNRRYQSTPLYFHPIWEEVDDDGQTVIEIKEADIKTFRIKKVDINLNATFFDNTTSVSYNGLVPYLSLENMSMQYYINKYYKAFQGVIENFQLHSGRILLSEIDILNINFFRLKYFKQKAMYFYLNKIRNQSGKLSEFELVAVRQFLKNQPPTTLGTYETVMNYESNRNISVNQLTSQTVPEYFDPEFDQPIAFKFTGGFNEDILLKNGETVIDSETEILIENWDLNIEDQGNTTDEHSASFTFKIKDAGSGAYSEVEGTLQVTVNEYINQPPVADAGEDYTFEITNDEFDSITPLDGSGSYDNTGDITTYLWEIITKPISSNATLTNSNGASSGLALPNNNDSVGSYTMRLTVTDEFGLTDTDEVTIQVMMNEINPE
ncbi:PKD domain-containing protein [Zunongwangia sp. SCSIO 43204]|uniref:PKD domain-containing protein n=1 Tax=Zunongwangia sp. SCSIO 43204 TaxID=2779359 RepID=UPI001CA7BA73|nr:PKD domain-containing protein [Zunongwangia sp. SCSIO 43204]UAB85692.1 PKD domain-containing protein [Zunongwangia sp. SCSIO 43204]